LGGIFGRAQSTGTRGHQFVSKVIGYRYALDPRVSKVTFDLGYKRLLGVGGFKYWPRPDVGVLFKNGTVRIYEVASKTDITKISLKINNDFMLKNGIQGTTKVSNIAKFWNSIRPK